MQNAVYLFIYGGFHSTRLLDPENMNALWDDDLFNDEFDDAMAWQFQVVAGGKVLELSEEDGVSIEVRERPQGSDDWRVVTCFAYANDGLILRSDAYDAMSRWVAQRVGFVERVAEVPDLTAGLGNPYYSAGA